MDRADDFWVYAKYDLLGGKKMVRPRGTDNAKVIQVIKTTSILGNGTKEAPVRQIYQYWDFEGNMLAKHDTLDENISNEEERLPTHTCENYPPSFKSI